jgi:vacuolar-type H+-ATPase catalytic subunit A/Vma1
VLYNQYKDDSFNSTRLEKEVSRLMQDDDVTKKKGIYWYVLTGKEKYLNIRAFTPTQKRELYEKQKGICPICKEYFKLSEMEADHITPWHEGGKTDKCCAKKIIEEKEENRFTRKYPIKSYL